MRRRGIIEKEAEDVDVIKFEDLRLEVALDIRDMLIANHNRLCDLLEKAHDHIVL